MNGFPALGVKHIFMGAKIKTEAYYQWVESSNLKPEEILYMGDDIPDYEVMKLVGLPTCPADAAPEIKTIQLIYPPKKEDADVDGMS